MKKITTTIFLTIGLTLAAFSQILPPDFICVNADTLIWSLPNNTCGTFNSYDIYFSDNEAGPYTLLTTITDQNQTSFFHATAGSNVWYYYLLSNFDCPGEPQIASDTLDNRSPVVAVIEVASVENGEVELSWYPSPSPEVTGYIIYRQTNIGVIPIDTVYGGLTYTDMTAMPNNTSETYFVNALDDCGNTSIFDNPHTTIFLETAVNACDQTILLNWNAYQNWQNPIATNEIWLSINNSPFQMVGMADGQATSFLYENANDTEEYCFFVKAIESNTGVAANSNIFCQTLDIVQPIRELFIKNVSVTPTDAIEITYTWNTNAEINQVQILSDESGSLTAIASEMPPNPLPASNIYTDLAVNPNIAPISYQILTTDDCDTLFYSNFGSSIFLSGQAVGGNINQLFWTPLGIDNATDISYTLFKTLNGLTSQIGSATASDTTFFDPLDVETAEDANACYYLIATATITLPDGSMETIASRSNTACIDQPVKIWVPNAFAPRGVNQIFRPLVVFGENAAYEMQIFDRYGKQIFESREVENGWNGKIKDRDAPPGAYVYTITVTQSNGEAVMEKGTVILIR